MKRLGMLGTLVWDRIWPYHAPAAAPVNGWGGLTYSLAAAAAAHPPGWTLVPLVKIGRDCADDALRFLAEVPGLQLEPGVRVVPEPNNRVELRYTDAVRRCERLTGGVPPWTPAELEPLLPQLDALYINFISGSEMDLATAEWVRGAFGGPIYADLHSLLLGRGQGGHRAPRRLPHTHRWLRCFDAVQANEDEVALLAGAAGAVLDFAYEAVREHTLLMLVTRGGAGVEYTVNASFSAALQGRRTAPDGGPPLCKHVPTAGGEQSGDPTGCGDVWGATCFAGLLSGDGLRPAILRAHNAAMRNLKHSGAEGLFQRLSR